MRNIKQHYLSPQTTMVMVNHYEVLCASGDPAGAFGIGDGQENDLTSFGFE